MGTALRCVVIVLLPLAWAAAARAQAFENAPVGTLGVGVLVPTARMSDLYGPGVVGRLGFRAPISRGTSVGVEAGVVAPKPKSGTPTLYQFPVRAMLYFPLAAEGGSTPYVAIGPGVTFNSVGSAGAGTPKGQKRDPYFTYAVKVGWAFRPEHMATTLFDLGARYEQQFIGYSSDFRSVEVEACVGRTF
jgi:hypothetical protein